MAKYLIEGGRPLNGVIRVSGSKNASLPILAASLLYPGKSLIYEVPVLRDIEVMFEVLQYLGARVQRLGSTVQIDATHLSGWEVKEDLTRKMRASNLVLGSLLGRLGKAWVSMPGGCNIGIRPMDLHLKGLLALGANLEESFGCIRAEAKQLQGADIVLDMPSVGATENIMLAAVGAEGITNIHNAAREPEITDLQEFLKKMGVRVQGAGSDLIQIEGTKNLLAPQHTIIPDRIEAGTHLIAAAICGGQVRVENVIPEHLDSLLAKLKESGAEIEVGSNYLQISIQQPLKAIDVKTLFYPGFPTDLQPQIMALMTKLKGTSVVTEMVFENRFKHVSELRRMGADILLEGQTAIIKGVDKLGGSMVEASDLRAGAALVLAALGAENTSIIDKIEHIERGYENLESKYNLLGAKMRRISD